MPSTSKATKRKASTGSEKSAIRNSANSNKKVARVATSSDAPTSARQGMRLFFYSAYASKLFLAANEPAIHIHQDKGKILNLTINQLLINWLFIIQKMLLTWRTLNELSVLTVVKVDMHFSLPMPSSPTLPVRATRKLLPTWTSQWLSQIMLWHLFKKAIIK